MAAQPAAAQGYAVAPGVVPELATTPEVGEVQSSADGGQLAGRQQEGLLLVDAKNGFNMLSRMGMLWMVRHRAGKLSRFAFNCYRHEIRLLCRRPGEEALRLLSKEGVTQGDPLTMALYGVALLSLAELLREDFPLVMQPWYADNVAMMGTARPVAGCFK